MTDKIRLVEAITMSHWIKRKLFVCTSDMICKASRVFASTNISDDPQLIDVMYV